MPTSSSSPHLSAAQRRSHLQSPRCTCEAAARQSGRRASRPAAPPPPRAPPGPPPAAPPPPNPTLTLFAKRRNWFKPGGWGKRETRVAVVEAGWGVCVCNPSLEEEKRKIGGAGSASEGFGWEPRSRRSAGGGGAGARAPGGRAGYMTPGFPGGPSALGAATPSRAPPASYYSARFQLPPF